MKASKTFNKLFFLTTMTSELSKYCIFQCKTTKMEFAINMKKRIFKQKRFCIM